MILRAVEKRLKTFGHKTVLIDEDKLGPKLVEFQPDLVFSMARSLKAITSLKLIAPHTPVINAPDTVTGCLDRIHLYKKLEEAGVRIPKTRLIPLKGIFDLEFPYVLKHPTAHGKKDKTFVVDFPCKRRGAVNSLAGQGLKEVLAQEFVEGESLKFYGVGSEIFLIGKKTSPLTPVQAEIIAKQAREACCKVAQLQVYGGDFIYTPSGPVFTDVNDWPSFSPIRKGAAERIANYLLSYF